MCDIKSVQITGQNPASSYELMFRIKDCEAVDVAVFDAGGAGSPLLQAPNLPVNGPLDGTGYRVMVRPFTPTQSHLQPCGGKYRVVITCLSKLCDFDEDVDVTCKDAGSTPAPPSCSPTATMVVRNSAGTEVNVGQPCLPADTYTIEIVSTLSANAIVMWFVTPVPSSGGSTVTQVIPGVTGRQLSYTLPDSLLPAGTARIVTANISDVTSSGSPCGSGASAFLPPAQPGKCPTAITFQLRLGGQLIAPDASNPLSYSNLAAGHYELRVTDPAGSGVNYDWFSGGTTPAQSSSSNVFTFDLAASNSPRQIEVFVRAGECCPVLRSTVNLTMGSSSTPIDPGTTTGTTPTPVTPTFPPICGLIRFLAALAVLIFLLSSMFVVCPSPITPLAIVTAAAALVAAGILLAIAQFMCGLGFCGFWRIVIWALRWAIVLGIIGAVGLTISSILWLPLLMCVLLVALAYGIICGVLIVWIRGFGCTIPTGFSLP